MPILNSQFSPIFLLRNPHLQTILSSKGRILQRAKYARTRLELTDGDFLDIDYLLGTNNKTIILSHGLEGSSSSSYLIGLSNYFHKAGYTVIAWNFRGCSGEENRLIPWYHSGMSQDLRAVITWALAQNNNDLYLLGCSVGGNITLKYLGEEKNALSPRIKAAIAVSVPCNLESCATALAKASTRIYMNYFLTSLKKRITDKSRKFPHVYSLAGWDEIKSFKQLDDRYTAPLHGYANAEEYWQANSSIYFLSHITIPTLILNSLDDPFLGQACHPEQEALNNPHITLELSRFGGHMGFLQKPNSFYVEARALHYFTHAS